MNKADKILFFKADMVIKSFNELLWEKKKNMFKSSVTR